MPIKITVENKYCGPWSATKETITTANAPVAPEIMPGLPPTIAVIKPMIKAAYNPESGVTPATKAKAIASGTKARETVRPDNNSTLKSDIEAPSLGIYSSLLKPIELANWLIEDLFMFIGRLY